MQIIISHDVDHLYPSDHFTKDLIFPKLFVRSLIHAIKREISLSSLIYRFLSIFDSRLCRIPEVIEFDRSNNIPSTFFFGMANILGMSYTKEKAKKWILFVKEHGFDVGVHGVDILNYNNMLEEYKTFQNISEISSFGIRTHYVRYNSFTFEKMAQIGYAFDTSEFNKINIEFKQPYKVGEMWEFPLHLMDGYVMKNNLEMAKRDTVKALEFAQQNDIKYVTFLFHDYLFNSKTYPLDKQYYEWFVAHCKEKEYKFISYSTAINQLEKTNGG